MNDQVNPSLAGMSSGFLRGTSLDFSLSLGIGFALSPSDTRASSANAAVLVTTPPAAKPPRPARNAARVGRVMMSFSGVGRTSTTSSPVLTASSAVLTEIGLPLETGKLAVAMRTDSRKVYFLEDMAPSEVVMVKMLLLELMDRKWTVSARGSGFYTRRPEIEARPSIKYVRIFILYVFKIMYKKNKNYTKFE